MYAKRGAKIALSLSMLLSLGLSCAANAEQFRAADVQAAIKGLSSRDDSDRKSAAYHLSEMGAVAKDAVPALIAVLQNDTSANVKGETCNALGHIGPDAAPAIPAIIAFLQSADGGYERTYAASALGNIGKQPEQAVPVLIATVQGDSEPVVRQLAARALASFGVDAKSAVPVLIESIKTGGKEMREAAACGLEQIPCSPKDVPALTELLSDEIDSARGAAAKSIGGAGSEAVGAVPKLIALLKDNNEHVRAMAASGLGEIGPDAREALPALKAAVKDDPLISFEARAAIDKIKNKK
ncbi:MAG: HEAT repeat domain-containing protein [Candidatus Obscuribacterales bacterium]|nr:HEAT repeat domain-containing protein [Cyanobacteria bacterium SZAS LIN-5]RTL38808.1 MAG: HEAT repeat domain-containing protein [Candidatus Melainabacteria bacterium]